MGVRCLSQHEYAHDRCINIQLGSGQGLPWVDIGTIDGAVGKIPQARLVLVGKPRTGRLLPTRKTGREHEIEHTVSHTKGFNTRQSWKLFDGRLSTC